MADETMRARARELVGIVTGKRQPIDNLMSNEDVAYAALTAAHAAGLAEGRREERERAAKIADDWLQCFGDFKPDVVSAQTWAGDAIRDISAAIRGDSSPELTAVNPSDPRVIIAGIRQFGLAPDGSDLRDLEAAFARLAAAPQAQEGRDG